MKDEEDENTIPEGQEEDNSIDENQSEGRFRCN